jgi:hypothetical protein
LVLFRDEFLSSHLFDLLAAFFRSLMISSRAKSKMRLYARCNLSLLSGVSSKWKTILGTLIFRGMDYRQNSNHRFILSSTNTSKLFFGSPCRNILVVSMN